MPKDIYLPKYYAFGSLIQARTQAPEDYRFGFNGKENDGETGTQDYGFRIYNPSLARFLSIDPLTNDYPFYTPYQFAGNNPIQYIDLDGKEQTPPSWFNFKITIKTTVEDLKKFVKKIFHPNRPVKNPEAEKPQIKMNGEIKITPVAGDITVGEIKVEGNYNTKTNDGGVTASGKLPVELGPIKTDIPLTTTEIPIDGDNTNNKGGGPSGPKTYTRKNDPTMPPDPNNKAGGSLKDAKDLKQKIKNYPGSSLPKPKQINLGNSSEYTDGTPVNNTSTPTNTTTPVNNNNKNE